MSQKWREKIGEKWKIVFSREKKKTEQNKIKKVWVLHFFISLQNTDNEQ